MMIHGVVSIFCYKADGATKLNSCCWADSHESYFYPYKQGNFKCACDTEQGTLSGDGVIGLSRSLISAGTPSVIVTLWKIPDIATSTLMTDFYQNLQQNPDKAVALRKAMLKTMKQYPEPKNWGAFQYCSVKKNGK
jgi:hypothetical protein